MCNTRKSTWNKQCNVTTSKSVFFLCFLPPVQWTHPNFQHVQVKKCHHDTPFIIIPHILQNLLFKKQKSTSSIKSSNHWLNLFVHDYSKTKICQHINSNYVIIPSCLKDVLFFRPYSRSKQQYGIQLKTTVNLKGLLRYLWYKCLHNAESKEKNM